MPNYKLYPLLTYLTLTVDNSADDWEDKLEFIGTDEQWKCADMLEEILSNN